MTGMSQSHCCCDTPAASPCEDCEDQVELCCLKVTSPGWTDYDLTLYRSGDRAGWETGDECPLILRANTNFCGLWESTFGTYGGCSGGSVIAKTTDAECGVVKLTLRLRFYTCVADEFGHWYEVIFLHGYTQTITTTPDWHLGTSVFPAMMVTPRGYGDSFLMPELYVTTCPEEFIDLQKDPDEVVMHARAQQKIGGQWVPVTTDVVGVFYAQMRNLGTCWCNKQRCADIPEHRSRVMWMYEPLFDQVTLSVFSPNDTYSGQLEIDMADWNCGAGGPFYVYSHIAPGSFRWKVTKIASCSTVVDPGDPEDPDPPPCDPLCWPACVLCPEPLSMSIVVSQNTTCCFNGTFGLTYNAGANNFYLASPVGYTPGSCGGIRTFVMTCDSETSVTFTWKYRDEDGNDHDRTDVVDAACSGGTFETAAVEVLSTLFTPGLCNRGTGKGANVRVVGV